MLSISGQSSISKPHVMASWYFLALQIVHLLAVAHLEGNGSPETALNCVHRLSDECESQSPQLSFLALRALHKLGSEQVLIFVRKLHQPKMLSLQCCLQASLILSLP